MSRNGKVLGIETSTQDLARRIAESLPVTVASVALWDRPSLSLTITAIATRRPLAVPLPLTSRVSLGSAPAHRVAFERGQPVFVDLESPDGTAAREEVAQALIPDLRAIYLVPIHVGRETVGVLGLGEMRSASREPISPEKRERCRTILREFAASLEPAWEAGRLRRQGRAMLSLLGMVREMFGAQTVQGVLAACTAEVARWLGVPVRSLLAQFDAAGQIQVVARCGFPDAAVSRADAAQILLAFIRSRTGHDDWPVGVVRVADDPLDPLRALVPDSCRWTRITLPLMVDERLLGLMCLYVEDLMHPTGWELEAFCQRAEIVSRGLVLVSALREHAEEREWLARVVYAQATSQHAALSQTLVGIQRLVTTELPERVNRFLAELGSVGASPDHGPTGVAESLPREVAAVLDDLRAGIPAPDTPSRDGDVNALVRRVAVAAWASLEGSGRQGRAPVQLSLELSTCPLVARMTPELVLALVHALENAIEATPEGGQIWLRTGQAGGDAVISIEDGGAGLAMSEEEAFTPLVRTKSRPHLRLGLAVLRTVVQQQGGAASLGSGARGGGLLQIRLPLAAAEREGAR